MLKTYITIAWRNFIRNKILSIINVLGLSIGISASLAIFLIVHYDFNFDKFENDPDRIYRIVTDIQTSTTTYHVSGVPSPLALAVKKDISGIEEVIGFHQFNGDGNVKVPKKDNEKPMLFRQQSGIIMADPSYFKLIPYQWLAGSLQTALADPFQVVLTAERAKIYFPSTSFASIIGKQIIYDDSIKATVSGIVKDQVQNTDFIFKEFISQSTIAATGLKRNYGLLNWTNIQGSSQLLVKLSPAASPKNIESQLQLIETKNNPGATISKRSFHLQPFDDIHFNSMYSTYGDYTANKPTLYALLSIAAFLLVLACINFINLTTALSNQRAKEIGVRKSMGGSKNQLIIQFLVETLFISFISLIISLPIASLLLRIFADFIPRDLHFDLLHQPYLISFSLILTVVVAILAGFYPAFVLSRFKPAIVLKTQAYNGSNSTRKTLLRKGLTISQFLIAQVFIMATLIAVKQINFVLNKDMGFRKDAIITMHTPFPSNRMKKNMNKRFVLLNEIKQIPGVQMASLAAEPPAIEGWNSDNLTFTDGKKVIQTDVLTKFGDTNYLKLYNIRLLAGRNIRASDTANEFLVNETYMHVLGFQNPEQLLNKQINRLPIVGVMADFNPQSLHAPIKPIAFSSEMGNSWELEILLRQGNAMSSSWTSTIASIEKAFKKLYPDDDFSYTFLDASIAKFYTAEQDMSRLLKWATGLAILISCMGLLGLVIFTTQTRTKEIGIRKVLGASVRQIISILSKDFVQLVLIASFIAMPVAWWAMHKWLESFAYKTEVNWWVFALSALIMMVIALLTLSFQIFRAASANPVESLRAE